MDQPAGLCVGVWSDPHSYTQSCFAARLFERFRDAKANVVESACIRRSKLSDMRTIFDCTGFLIAGIMLDKVPCNLGILGIERVNQMLRVV
jgi:hypothetical protein